VQFGAHEIEKKEGEVLSASKSHPICHCVQAIALGQRRSSRNVQHLYWLSVAGLNPNLAVVTGDKTAQLSALAWCNK
jgi:hypothetical protein